MKKLYKFSDFLKNRENRYKPKEAEKFGFQRIDKINFSGEIFLSNKNSNTDMILIKPGDLVISGINVEKGAIAVYEGNDDVLATIHFSSYQYDPKIIDIEFLKLFVKSPLFKKLITSATNGGIKTEIKPKHLLPLEILLPEISEQKQIIIDIKEVLKKNKVLEDFHILNKSNAIKLKQSILKDAIQGKLVPQDSNDETAEKLLEKIKEEKEKLIKEGKIKREKPSLPISKDEIQFELPKSWKWAKLSEICLKITDGFHNTPPLSKTGFPYVMATQIKQDKIDFDNCYFVDEKFHRELYNKARPEKGDILYVNIGAGSGTPAIIDFDGEFSFKNSAILKVPKNIDNKYIYYFLIYVRQKIFNEVTQGGAQPFLSLKKISEIKIPIPPLNEQKKIVEKVESLMKICDEQEKNINETKENINKLNQAILREMFQ